MWVVAGVLLGLVVFASLVGLHSGPHAHLVAGVVGVLGAAWLVFMLADGRSAPVLWALLGADVVVSAVLGLTAWRVLAGRGTRRDVHDLQSQEGVAVCDLAPIGIVRVAGEEWSAESVNGTVRTGTRVQVLRAASVRLEVWGEDAEVPPPEGIFSAGRAPQGQPTGTADKKGQNR